MTTALYSAAIFEADSFWGASRRVLFDYTIGQTIPGGPHNATGVHTNMPRPSWSGLPQGWAMQVDRWRASTNLRFLVDPVLEWAADTQIMFQSSGLLVARSPLIDLLMAPQPVADPRDNDNRIDRLRRGYPVPAASLVLHAHVGFDVQIESTQSAPIDGNVRRWLVENAIDLKSDEQRSLGDKVAKSRLIVWVWLEGVLVRH